LYLRRKGVDSAADGVESAVKKEYKKAEKNEPSRFPAGLPTSSDMQLLFMQHAIYKMGKLGRAAIITNGSPLFSGNTTSGESQIRRYMLENDLIEAIIALPTDLFYNTSIGIYAFILSKNKRTERRGKIQLINAVDMWKPLRKSLGKKRKEISRDDMRRITEIYAEFSEGPYCKIFDNEEFMYKEYAVYQPLQRTGSLSSSNIAALKSSAYFTANGQIFNEAEYGELLETDPREDDAEKKFQKFQKGKVFTEAAIAILEEHADGAEYKDFSEFTAKLKELIGDVDGMSASRLNGIAMELSVIDKTAVVQKDKKGNVLPDTTTKDTELVGLKIDVEEYFQREVYPHVPDALYIYDYDPNKKSSATNKEKLGAEFPFTLRIQRAGESRRFACTVHRDRARLVGKGCGSVGRGEMTDTMKPSGVDGFFDIPADWEVNKMAYVFSFGKGLSITKEELQDEGIPAISYGDIHSRYGFEVAPEVNELRFVDPKYLKTSRSALLKFGDFVFADTSEDIAGSGNFTHLNSQETTFASYHTITARAIRNLDYRYMAYLFDSEPFRTQIRNSVSGVKVYSITQLILKNAKVLLPPLPEQRAIAALLDERCGYIYGIIADLERQVEVLRQYKKALITETVTKGLDRSAEMKDSGIAWMGEVPKHWEIKRLKFLGSARNGLTYSPDNVTDEEKGVLVLRSSNIQNSELAFDDNVFVNTRIPREIVLQENDLLICSRNGSRDLIGKCALIDKQTAGSTYGAFMCVYRSRYNKFIHYVFLSEIFGFYLGTFLTSTVNQLTNMNLYNIIVPIPLDEKEQSVIVEFLDEKCAEADALIANKQRSIDTMWQYKKSLIYEYVTGKKRVAQLDRNTGGNRHADTC